MATISPTEKGKSRSKCRKWRIFVSCGTDEYGRRIQRSKRVRDMTYSEAKEEAVRFECECLGISKRDTTFADYARNYLERRRPLLKESTYNNRRSVVATLVKIFGESVKMSGMTSELVESKMNELLVRGVRSNTKPKPCKASYVSSLYTYLSSIMMDAVRAGIITRSPLDGIKRPSGKIEKREAPTMKQLADLVDEMDVSNAHEMAIILQCLLGVRRGEALALRWQDIDFDESIVHIRHNLAPNCVLTSTKTESSRRDLPMPATLAEKLRERQKVVKKGLRRAVRGGMLDEMPELGDVFVCCDEMGRPVGPGSQTCWWANHRDRFGMEGYTEHDLRHGYLTALARSGVHPSVAQALAGHQTSAITMEIYTSVDMSAKASGAEVFDGALGELMDGEE
ncbi:MULTISPECIES: site-specific integrase [unclassified Adlercreutzia]|uniref:tyrosine-type recombinase/integrase n=1 Tax=unclassified Adlercreutzia TaxID=2636013 RepID=UPI0013EA023C|nr:MULTISPECIES: site-specific integrase [unclassified Adlercreutzia]